eukprot:4242057-Amphidinium_carterae.1
MPQASLSKHFNKIGPAEVGIDEVSIHHLRVKLKVNAISSSSTADLDVRTPKSREKCKEDSVGVSSQATPERSEDSQKCCKEWIARDAVSSQWCCHCCMPRAVRCYNCQRNATQVMLFECGHSGCNPRACPTHSSWSAVDGK